MSESGNRKASCATAKKKNLSEKRLNGLEQEQKSTSVFIEPVRSSNQTETTTIPINTFNELKSEVNFQSRVREELCKTTVLWKEKGRHSEVDLNKSKALAECALNSTLSRPSRSSGMISRSGKRKNASKSRKRRAK